ncbi:uncharacterized protein LOC111869363 [Cryptotermes secundus]|uniref:uncharacterized protein LOC111869363 n=1 Tax=Cryptotermes secundus TaxID=105785 RepID=UPI000CD7DC35|nr:uncharacterized protein LOC111869363 [Cryptotermes secundus]
MEFFAFYNDLNTPENVQKNILQSWSGSSKGRAVPGCLLSLSDLVPFTPLTAYYQEAPRPEAPVTACTSRHQRRRPQTKEDFEKYQSIRAAEDMCTGMMKNRAFRDSAQCELQISSA